MRGKVRRGEFADRPRQTPYPMWGLEDPYRETNAGELYRHGERGFLTRYIVPPSDVVDKRRAGQGRRLLGETARRLLAPGFAVEDALVAVLAAASIAVLAYAMGPGMDACIDALGW